MTLIYKTENFILEAPDNPHIPRKEGGHLKISPKIRIENRIELSPKLAVECMRLTMVAGQAMFEIMNKQGIDIGRLNYQDNGNWTVFTPQGSYFHIHIYGRAKNAKIANFKYGEALYFPNRITGFYKDFKPLNQDDCMKIRKRMEELFKQKKYQDNKWKL